MPVQIASAPVPVAGQLSHVFRFDPASTIDIELRFYVDLDGLVDVAGGSRTVTVARVNRVVQGDDEWQSITALPLGTLAMVGGDIKIVGLGASGEAVQVTTSAGSNPMGALTFRVLVGS